MGVPQCRTAHRQPNVDGSQSIRVVEACIDHGIQPKQREAVRIGIVLNGAHQAFGHQIAGRRVAAQHGVFWVSTLQATQRKGLADQVG